MQRAQTRPTTTTLLSNPPAAAFDCDFASPVYSPDGTTIAFVSEGWACETIGTWVHELASGATSFIPSGWGPTFGPDGNLVAFTSSADYYGPTDTNALQDAYVHDLTFGSTALVSVNAAGTDSGNGTSGSPEFSPDGTKLLFYSGAANLVPGDGNGADDVFVRDLDAGRTIAVSTSAAGTATGNGWSQGGVFSPNGAKVAFQSIASNLGPTDPGTTADVYVRDLTTGAVTLVSVNAAGTGGGNGGSTFPRFSPDGTKIAFLTTASNLGPNETNGFEDVYVRDLVAGATTLASVNGAGTNAGNRDSLVGEFSPDGTKVLFGSRASDLGPTDTDSVPGCDYPSCRDVYERDLVTGRTTLVSANADGSDSGNADSLGGTYNADGSLVLFSSLADDLGPDDTNGHWDLYVAAVTSEG